MLPYVKEECEIVMMASYFAELGEIAIMVWKWFGKVATTKQEAKGRALKKT